jgi:hypothetical protein
MSCHENAKKRRFHGWTNPVLINGMSCKDMRHQNGLLGYNPPKSRGCGPAHDHSRARQMENKKVTLLEIEGLVNESDFRWRQTLRLSKVESQEESDDGDHACVDQFIRAINTNYFRTSW